MMNVELDGLNTIKAVAAKYGKDNDAGKAGLKAALRSTYRAAGVTEVGNDVSFKPPPAPRSKVKREEVRAAVERAFSQAGLGA